MKLIDIDELEHMTPIFRGRCGNALARSLMHILSVDKTNDLYERNEMFSGPAFADAVLRDMGLRCLLGNAERLTELPEGPFITISNHPYGSIDGIMLVDLFGHLRPGFKVLVNKFLGRIRALSPNFITVVPTGKERTAANSESIMGIKAALRQLHEGLSLGLFPSGAVSDLSLKDRCIRDREWQEPVIRLIRKAGVPVVPVRFFDRNSDFYYSLGLIDWKVRLLRLPGELFNKSGMPARIGIGSTISAEEQASFETIDGLRSFLRKSVYEMPLPEKFISLSEFLASQSL
ncbi:MAG: 1-acyl-sn-glycerol-3-phosphate acyltransferase [Candidatus Cryptobacteroides sp.]